MAIRTYPIRVGGNSGPWYPDQTETTWEKLGVPKETTTVTGRTRRVANFSYIQYYDALRANWPTHVFVNFMNYFDPVDRDIFIKLLRETEKEANMYPTRIYGFGPDDVRETYK